MARQTDGRETWHRLVNWDKEQAPSERLSAQILISEKFESVDPSHPLGGRDGLKDIICTKEGKKYITGCYFPRGQETLNNIKKKFSEDAEGLVKNSVEGFIFITNQELRLGERDELISLIDSKFEVILYHLERLATLLNSPANYGIRLEFLDIEMTKEEQLSFMATKDGIILDLIGYLKQQTKSVEMNPKENATSIEVQPEYIPPATGLNAFRFRRPYNKCSYCGFGYKIVGSRLDNYSGSTFSGSTIAFHPVIEDRIFSGSRIITCPKCGNTESYL